MPSLISYVNSISLGILSSGIFRFSLMITIPFLNDASVTSIFSARSNVFVNARLAMPLCKMFSSSSLAELFPLMVNLCSS